MILDFFNEILPWRGCKDYKADDVKAMKEKCFKDPEEIGRAHV